MPSSQQRRTPQRKSSRPDPVPVRALGWVGVVTLAGSVVALIAYIVIDAAGGHHAVTDGPIRGVTVVCLVACVGSLLIWRFLRGFVDDGRWSLGGTRWQRAMAIYVLVLLGLLALATLAGVVWGVSLAGIPIPYADVVGDVALGVLVAAMLLGILTAAIAGAVVMGGAKAAPIGIALCAGLVLGPVAQTSGPPWLLWIAIGLICIATAGYYTFGARGGFLPSAYLSAFSGWGTLVVALCFVLVGATSAQPVLLLLGAISIAASTGIWFAQSSARRRASAATNGRAAKNRKANNRAATSGVKHAATPHGRHPSN